MVQGIVKYMNSQNLPIKVDKVNNLVHRFDKKKIVELYISFE